MLRDGVDVNRRVVVRAGRVCGHRGEACDHRDRIAVGERHHGLGEGMQHGRDLLEMLWRLEHPALACPTLVLADLEHLAQELVARPLVVHTVVVAPARYECGRLEQHRRGVDREQLDLLVHVVDGHLVHAVELRHHLVDERDTHRAAVAATIRLITAVGLLGARRHRLEALPVREAA